MQAIHHITGITISIFIIAHLFNHGMAVFGIEAHQSTMEVLRKVYRIPVVEVLLITAFLFQSISGILLFRKLWKKRDKTSLEKAKMYSGLVLGLFILQHIPAIIGQRLYFDLDTNFHFAARVVLQKPFLYYFIPYYFIGIMAFALHLASIHREKISRFIGEKRASIHFYLILSFFFVIALVLLYTFTGGLYDIQIPEEYNVY